VERVTDSISIGAIFRVVTQSIGQLRRKSRTRRGASSKPCRRSRRGGVGPNGRTQLLQAYIQAIQYAPTFLNKASYIIPYRFVLLRGLSIGILSVREPWFSQPTYLIRKLECFCITCRQQYIVSDIDEDNELHVISFPSNLRFT
jgi:hypothetical protein